MLLQERALDPEVLETSRGTIRLWALGPTIYVIAMRGSMERPHSDLVMRYGERRWQVAGGRKLHMFHDWLEMGGYESRCRRDLTDWLLHRRDRYAEVHLAVRSKLVAMGVNAANVQSYLRFADGVIVGSSLKRDGKLANPVDPRRVTALAKAMR